MPAKWKWWFGLVAIGAVHCPWHEAKIAITTVEGRVPCWRWWLCMAHYVILFLRRQLCKDEGGDRNDVVEELIYD